MRGVEFTGSHGQAATVVRLDAPVEEHWLLQVERTGEVMRVLRGGRRPKVVRGVGNPSGWPHDLRPRGYEIRRGDQCLVLGKPA